jgi:amidohydrolase
MTLSKQIDAIMNDIISFFREMHQHPELSKNEYQTQARIKSMLETYDIPYDITADTGVIARINKTSTGPSIAIRADIDALPITEETNLPYQSIHDGIMHACGHDAHTAIALGVAILLNNRKDQLQGSVHIIFQPDEEVSAGAKKIVEEGQLDGVDTIIGLHVMPYLEVGEIEVRTGTLNASTCSVTIDIKGQAAHAAYPDQGIDAIVIAGEVINALQSIISRRVSPLEPAVLSFGIIQGGTKANILAQNVQLTGTLRTIQDTTKEQIKKHITSICNGIADAHGTVIKATFSDGYPPLINDEELVSEIVDAAIESPLITNLCHKLDPSMGAEDFGYYQQDRKGAFYHLGCGNKKKGLTSPLHSNTFQIDEDCLKVGIDVQLRLLLQLLNKKM